MKDKYFYLKKIFIVFGSHCIYICWKENQMRFIIIFISILFFSSTEIFMVFTVYKAGHSKFSGKVQKLVH